MKEVVEFIDRHYAKPLTVAELANRARLSPFHFIRTFRAATGLTPHQYVRERRLDRARHLLSTTTMPVTEVCQAVGFTSLGSFSTLFRRSTGKSPVAYRASERRPVYIPGCFMRMYRIGR
jgi:transcriptional regulator GlxA family with amidase domain